MNEIAQYPILPHAVVFISFPIRFIWKPLIGQQLVENVPPTTMLFAVGGF